ncbi:MAG: Trm112 family protein [Gammaproteobacteria bacterium]|nr:Trm112 family protein [Gammaproteobacteria bacterium]
MDLTLLNILCCPITHKSLSVVAADQLAGLNEDIARGELFTRGGVCVDKPMHEALLTACGRWVYPVIDGVPVLLEDSCVDLASQSAGGQRG